MSQDYRLKMSRFYEHRLNLEGIEVLKGQKMINSATYKIYLEDHTIGDLIRIYLLNNSDVKFAGYRVPHPLEDNLQIKVQTINEDTNKTVKDTLRILQKDLFEFQNQFDKLVNQKIKQIN